MTLGVLVVTFAYQRRRPRPVGPARGAPRPRLRRLGGLAGHPLREVGGRRAPARRMADRGLDRHARRGGCPRARRPLRRARRIGIDETSYRRGQRYLVVVVDHDAGRLVWAAPGRDRKTLRRFFDVLGTERCAQITLVSADATSWIATVVVERCPNATLCTDPFHFVQWATDALDDVRRETWNEARRSGQQAVARELKGALRALEEPRGSHRSPEGEARLDRHDERAPLPRVPAQRATAAAFPPADGRRPRAARGLAALGTELSHPSLRRARAVRGRAHASALQRAGRVGEHEDPAHHTRGLRLPLLRRARRARCSASAATVRRFPRGQRDPRKRHRSPNSYNKAPDTWSSMTRSASQPSHSATASAPPSPRSGAARRGSTLESLNCSGRPMVRVRPRVG